MDSIIDFNNHLTQLQRKWAGNNVSQQQSPQNGQKDSGAEIQVASFNIGASPILDKKKDQDRSDSKQGNNKKAVNTGKQTKKEREKSEREIDREKYERDREKHEREREKYEKFVQQRRQLAQQTSQPYSISKKLFIQNSKQIQFVKQETRKSRSSKKQQLLRQQQIKLTRQLQESQKRLRYLKQQQSKTEQRRLKALEKMKALNNTARLSRENPIQQRTYQDTEYGNPDINNKNRYATTGHRRKRRRLYKRVASFASEANHEMKMSSRVGDGDGDGGSSGGGSDDNEDDGDDDDENDNLMNYAYGDFSKFAFQQQQKAFKNEQLVDKIIKQALHSHKNQLKMIAKVQQQLQQSSKTNFSILKKILKLEKQTDFQDFVKQPEIYFLKKLILKKSSIAQLITQFTQVLLVANSYIMIENNILQRTDLNLAQYLLHEKEAYIPLRNYENLYFKQGSQSFNFLIDGKFKEKQEMKYLSVQERQVIIETVKMYLKSKNILVQDVSLINAIKKQLLAE